MRNTTLGAVGLAVIGSLVLTGCKNGDEELPAQPAASSPGGTSPTAGASASPSTGDSAAPAGAPGTAKSGQVFKIGEAAEIPYDYGDFKGSRVALTVTAIEQGTPADLEGLKLGDKANGKVPYYIRYTVKNIGATDMSYASVGHVRGLLGDGTEAQSLAVIGKFEKCKEESMPKGFTNGQTQTSCAIALAPSAQVKVAGAEYWGNPYNAISNGKGITWK
ncbi:hypothetical protein Snoj_05660 [Streptomyces nojiriensis]|uniref:DUF4352 domain-containing protein n=2 Tax=Streptomyces nojiriensis TaxID=66374 RepID=A0ABQ3SEW0_9ACTN|nr:hypothetical protein JYK04_06159 [Streptomyces nojiriensis]GGS01642.1 hypothetical protein GCM10010205_33020 [Streptomyces nojiriensis]GHI66648.1 hypothetical protein Snoj_05660 [Streptomyces nojiriensis]